MATKTRGRVSFSLGLWSFALLLLGQWPTRFVSAGDIAPFNLPLAIVASDFNRDGSLDLAVAVESVADSPPDRGWVSVILQNPDSPGKFFHRANYTTEDDPIAMAVGDLNGDGLPDLVVASASSHKISVLFQDPAIAGTFLPMTAIDVGSSQSGIAIGDLNHDGLPDIAVAVGTRNLKILYQDPSGLPGTFSPPTNLRASAGVWSVAIGDLDGDGANDLALIFTDNAQVGVLLQDPNHPATFQSEIDYAVGPQPLVVKIADVNGDGIPDLAVADLGTPTLSGGGVSILLQDAANRGSFLKSHKYAAGIGPQDVAVGDLNADGRPDLAVANFGDLSNGGNVSAMLQKDAGGTLAFSKKTYNGKAIPTGVAIGDFNGDGKLDIAAADGPTATIMFQKPTGHGKFLQPKVVGR
jgi:hypothetical protein